MGRRKTSSAEGGPPSAAPGKRHAGGRPRQGRAFARHLPRDEEILRIAAQVLYENGFDVTVEEIARAAGIVRGSFYNYFRSKDEVYERILAKVGDAYDARLELPRGASPLDALREAVSAKVRLAVTYPTECGLMLRVMRSTGPLAEAVRERAENAQRALRELIVAGQRDGSVRADDPQVLLSVAVSVVQHVPEWYVAQRALRPAEVVGAVTGFVMRGLVASGEGGPPD